MTNYSVPTLGVLAVLVAGCCIGDQPGGRPLAADSPEKEWIKSLRNGDIKWSAGTLGLEPVLVGVPANKVLEMGRRAVPALIDAMDDRKKFVAAHVLLGLITGHDLGDVNLDHADGNRYNGMTVRRRSGAPVEVYAAEMGPLKTAWEKWWKEKAVEDDIVVKDQEGTEQR